MSNRIITKRTAEANKVPTTSDIVAGELAINLTDKKLYSSDGSNVFQISENATQLNNRDTANRNRENHTGTQSISTIDELQTELNLKANLNSPTFTGNLVLPNNSRINNIEHFYQTTKPITRGNGSALVVGDRWWKTDEGTEWFWNGTYWLSPIQTWDLSTIASSTTQLFWRQALGVKESILVRAIKSSLWSNQPNTATNYWTINVFADFTKTLASSGIELNGNIVNTINLPAFTWKIETRLIEQIIPFDVPFIIVNNKVGNPPGSFVQGHTLYYNEVF